MNTIASIDAKSSIGSQKPFNRFRYRELLDLRLSTGPESFLVLLRRFAIASVGLPSIRNTVAIEGESARGISVVPRIVLLPILMASPRMLRVINTVVKSGGNGGAHRLHPRVELEVLSVLVEVVVDVLLVVEVAEVVKVTVPVLVSLTVFVTVASYVENSIDVEVPWGTVTTSVEAVTVEYCPTVTADTNVDHAVVPLQVYEVVTMVDGTHCVIVVV